MDEAPPKKSKNKRLPSPRNARELALVALVSVYEDYSYSNLQLNHLLERHPLSKEEKKFATTLFYGTLTETPALDELVARYSTMPIRKIDLPVLVCLRMAFWQLFFSRVPDSAAVNEAVKLVKRAGFTSASRMVNAVLRTAIRKETTYKPDSLESISGFPAELFSSMEAWLGSQEEVLQVGEAFRNKDRLSLRVRRHSLAEVRSSSQAEGAELFDPSFQDSAIGLKTGGTSLTALTAWQNGDVVAQGEAAMLPAQILSPEPGEVIADFCAAPGGKSIQIADLTGDACEVWSMDQSLNRTGLIEAACARLGVRSVQVHVADASDPTDWPFVGSPDRILLDVPCSGLGLIGSKPEMKFKWNEKKVKEELVPVQRAILAKAAVLSKPGTIIVYSTCTLNPAENEENIEDFLNRHPDFHPLNLTERLPKPVRERLLDLDPNLRNEMDNGYLTLWPHRTGAEGFFIAACMRRT